MGDIVQDTAGCTRLAKAIETGPEEPWGTYVIFGLAG